MQQALGRALGAAHADSGLYVAVANNPEVAACGKAIKDMMAHEQKAKKDEVQRQRKEEAQARTDKLLAELRAAREKCVCVCLYILYIYMYK